MYYTVTKLITIYDLLYLQHQEVPLMVGLGLVAQQSRPTEFLDFTSLTLDEFHQLVPPFEAAFQAQMRAWRLDGQPRKAGRFTVYENCPLPTPEERLFFRLTYLKTYALQVFQGLLFGMSQSQANQWSHLLLPALRSRRAHPLARPHPLARRPRSAPRRGGVGRDDSDRAAGGGTRTRQHTVRPHFAHDGTERRIVRPQAPTDQTDCYSGKKKDHTVKNVLLVNTPLTLLFLSDTYGGRVHNKRIAETTPYPLPAGSRRLQDLGFVALTLPQVDVLMPSKKPHGQELTVEQQLDNQALHQRRLRIFSGL